MNIPEFKPRTKDEILAENDRIRAIPVQGSTPPAPKIAPQQRIATLRDRLSKFVTFPTTVDMPIVQDEPRPECPICGNTGAIKYRVPIGHPMFGKLQRCPDPACPVAADNDRKRRLASLEREVRHFGTPEHIAGASMADYAPDDRRRAVGAARIFLEHGEVKWNDVLKRSLVFYGAAGRGKTHLISAIRNELDARNQPTHFHKVRTLLKAVQRGYSDESDLSDFEVENILMNSPFLFIDELETGLSSGDRSDIFEAIIDHRCRVNLPTIIATNLAQDEIREVWNDRIHSRLIHMAWWIEMSGASLRDTSAPVSNKKQG